MSYIVWTKEWSSADDGTTFTGADLQNIQNDIAAIINGGLTNENMSSTASITADKIDWAGLDGNINFIIYGGGVEITTGIKGDIHIPFAITLTGVTLLADQSGDIEIDLWVDELANFPPTVADTIVASAPPTITSDTYSQDNTLSGWTVDVSAGSVIRVNVNSVTTITQLTIALAYVRA